ncbi:GAF domain-containing protein [Streptomyces asoensis]|uniref:GAF domain-containing protein n=1 Tax=Streptomyces asoensis TaxID=249586 RepID=UPI0033CE0571
MPLTPTPQPTPAPATPPPTALPPVERRIELFTDVPATELHEMATRLSRLNELGIPLKATEALDHLTDDLAERTGFLYAMVNAFAEEQTFLGLHNPPPDAGYPLVGRTMSRSDGYCPEVIRGKLGLPLFDVAASPRFQSNPVVDAIGIQSYFGVPVIDAATGLALLTVCVVDPEPRSLADAARLLRLVHAAGRQAADILQIITTPAP